MKTKELLLLNSTLTPKIYNKLSVIDYYSNTIKYLKTYKVEKSYIGFHVLLDYVISIIKPNLKIQSLALRLRFLDNSISTFKILSEQNKIHLLTIIFTMSETAFIKLDESTVFKINFEDMLFIINKKGKITTKCTPELITINKNILELRKTGFRNTELIKDTENILKSLKSEQLKRYFNLKKAPKLVDKLRTGINYNVINVLQRKTNQYMQYGAPVKRI